MKTSTIRAKIIYWLALISLASIGANMPLSDPQQANGIVFAVIGDYGMAGQPEADVASLVKSWNPDFIVTVGDNNLPDGAAYSIDQNIGQYYHEYIFFYNGKYGSGSDTRKFFPALGNHDWHQNSPNAYTNYFDLPGNERYYDFIYGPVHFFILDSIEDEPEGNTATSGQAKWLKSALTASTSSFNLVVTHYPPYSSGKHGAVPFMQWPFKEWGADAVLAGHNHIYERLYVNGMIYFVNGLGGDELGNFRSSILPESQVRYNQNYGAMRIEATSAYMKFQFITRDNVLIDEYVLSNSIPVVSSVSSASPKLTNANILDLNVSFSEHVSGVDVSDFALTANGISGAYISNISGADASYTVSINTGTGNGNLRLDLLDNDSITDIHGATLGNAGAGNGNSSSEVYSIDKTAPAVSSITRVSASPTNAANADFAVAFTESVSGVEISDFSLSTTSGAAISNVNGSGAAYIVSINTGSADDILRLDVINNNSITDTAGNLLGGGFTSGESYAIDKTAPSAVSILRANPNPSGAISVDFNVTFSEPVFNVDASDFVLSTIGIKGAYITNVSGRGGSYIISVNTGSDSGDLRLDLINNLSIVDAVGVALVNTCAGETYTFDKTAPIVISILRVNAGLTNAGNVDFNVAFSDSVSGVDVSDFVLSATGINGAYISNMSGAGANYVVSANTGRGDGTLRLDVIDNDSIINIVGNQLGTIGIGNGNFNSTDAYTIDKTPPFVISILRANPAPSKAASVDYIVNFSEPVSGVDVSDFVLNTASSAFISGVNGSGSSYVISITTGTGLDSLRLDMMDNDSILDAANSPTGGAFTTGEIYTINKVPPVVTSILRANTNPSNATSANFIVNFSEPVSGVDVSDFILATTGVSGASITGISGASSSYVISVITGINNGTIRLDLVDNNSIVSFIGNTLGGADINDGNFTIGEVYEVAKFSAASKDFPAPILSAPTRNPLLNTSTPKFVWIKVSDTQYYEVVIARDNTFAQIILTQFVNETYYTIPVLGDGTYYWRVRAYTFNNQAGKFSGIESFSIDTTPPLVPVLLTPKNNATLSTRYKFRWENSGAARYQIEIDNNADFSSPEWSSWRRDAFYTISAMRKGTYYWRVRAKDIAENWSAWSTVFKLIVP